MYAPESSVRSEGAQRLIAALRRAHGVILSTPCYHGSVSGLVKNALDYTEDMCQDAEPYLDGRAVGLIVCGHGWQSTGVVLSAFRSIVHALRGWPTPMGVAINTWWSGSTKKARGSPSSGAADGDHGGAGDRICPAPVATGQSDHHGRRRVER